ncbi:MAG TPA: DNRLRE domain-containing protein [Candidatus Hydrogenedentes bacterium]|nr:DNRLRE domain-containing protein [Candidatus Hydrogenedentota bacterium]
MRRTVLLSALLALSLSPGAFAIGTRTHAEIGRRCAEQYLAGADAMLPGLGSLVAKRANLKILYTACAFPDWGYGNINPNAGEASHWNPFMRAWAGALRARGAGFGLSEEMQREMAFFLGAVCHNIADIPWHFSTDGHLSFLEKSARMEGGTHTLTEIGGDFIQYQKDRMRHWGTLTDYFPLETVYGALTASGVPVTREELRRGYQREQMILWAAPVVTTPFVEDYRQQLPWTIAHLEDYYFGGIAHNAAACAMWCRYWYAETAGGHCLQQMPAYGAPGNAGDCGYCPYLGVADATLAGDLPAHNTGAEAFLAVSAAPGKRRDALVRFDLSHLPAGPPPSRAVLWMYCERVTGTPPAIGVAPAAAPWAEGGGASDPFNGEDGRPAGEGEVTWARRPQGEAEAPRTAETVPAAGQWASWEVTPLVRGWLEDPGANHGLRLMAAGEGTALFFSSQAFQASADGYCGGTRVAFRPMLVLLP